MRFPSDADFSGGADGPMSVMAERPFSERVAIITGVGGALARALVAAGAKVAALSLNGENARRTAEEIADGGEIVRAYTCDILDAAVY